MEQSYIVRGLLLVLEESKKTPLVYWVLILDKDADIDLLIMGI